MAFRLNVCLVWAAASLLAACGGADDTERRMVPFDDWRGGHELTIPVGVMGRGCPDAEGMIVGIACFDPPIHPEGRITWLNIGGHDVPLVDTLLKDGMLETRDFGAVEIIMPRTDRTEMLATDAQIKAIEAWLKEQDEAQGGAQE